MRPSVPVNRCEGRLSTEKRGAALLLALAAGALVCGCKKRAADNAPRASPPALPVQVQIAPAVKIPDTTEYLSILKSRHSAAINPQVEGQITRIFVKSGDHVRAGTPLLQIDPLKQEATVNSQEASRAAQEANLRYAKVQLDREKRLFEGGVVAERTLRTTVAEPGSVEAYIYVPADRTRDLRLGVPVHLIDAAGRDLANS